MLDHVLRNRTAISYVHWIDMLPETEACIVRLFGPLPKFWRTLKFLRLPLHLGISRKELMLLANRCVAARLACTRVGCRLGLRVSNNQGPCAGTPVLGNLHLAKAIAHCCINASEFFVEVTGFLLQSTLVLPT